MRAWTSFGKTMETLIHHYQLWAGIQQPILVNTTPCLWIPNRWISRVHRMLQSYNIKIHHDTWTIPSLRQHNVFLMEAVLDLGLTTPQLGQINTCRMYLQVTMLAEIVDHTGYTLLPQAFIQGHTDKPPSLQTISHSTLQWPMIHPPTKTCWKLWQWTICNIFTGSPSGTHLHQPLGPWNKHYQKTCKWHWRLSPNSCLLHQPQMENCPHAAIPIKPTCTQIQFSVTVPTNQVFTGPPVTLTDPYQWCIKLPVPPLPIRQNVAQTLSIPQITDHTIPDYTQPMAKPPLWPYSKIASNTEYLPDQ